MRAYPLQYAYLCSFAVEGCYGALGLVETPNRIQVFFRTQTRSNWSACQFDVHTQHGDPCTWTIIEGLSGWMNRGSATPQYLIRLEPIPAGLRRVRCQ